MAPLIQLMTPNDSATIASLHAASWKVTYRGILSDDYLDTRASSERAAHWEKRLSGDAPHSFGVIAREHDSAVGFAWVDLDDDPNYGHLLDNLHVHASHKGGGIGRSLMRAVAGEIMARSETRSLFLWVYEENRGARAFYDRVGGTPGDRTLMTTLDDRRAWQWRYSWRDVTALL